MTKLSIVFVGALALAAFGCKKKGGDCAGAITHSMDLAKADMAKTPGMDDKMMQKMKDIGMQHCKDDKWSADVLKCMTDAKTETEAQGCYTKLTPEQQDKMNKAAMEAMQPPGGAAGSAGGAMGSDTGSAAAGSAAGSGGAMGSDTGSAGAGSAPAGGSAAAGSAAAGSAAAPK